MWAPLLPIQDLDTQLLRLDHQLSTLPERAARDAVDDDLAALRREIDAAESAKHDLQRAQKRIEDEVSLISDKVAAEEAKLYGEGSTDPGHLQDLQAEIASLKRSIDALEDDELELMEQIEPIDTQLAELAERQAGLDADAAVANAALAEAEASLAAERDRVVAERDALAGSVDADALVAYDRARAQMGGIAVAAMKAGTCGACHMKLSAVELDRVQRLPDDAEVRCEECGRYLVRV